MEINMKKYLLICFAVSALSINLQATDSTSPDNIDWKKYGDVEYCRSITKYDAMKTNNYSEQALNKVYYNCMCEKKGYKEFCKKSKK